MKVLITGGCGFIGSNFVRYLLNYGYRINVLDKLTYAGRKENLRGILKEIKFLQADITNPRDVEKAIKGCKIVINFAAESHVDRSIKKPAPFLKTNILGTWILLEKALKHKIDLFIQVSSDEVYGSISKGFFKENSPLNPSSPYSASKASGDNLCQSYYRTFGLPII
ncbi:MAG: SDR family NAD(P)-dependent oxidoreductase, partial [Candidatus Omnitrophica bacterium]|nr:SDR family NAD(P)-dependent oxidoreductase [Candidatus Omnitrophota bacterium]